MITYLSLGTNLGDKSLNLLKAITIIAGRIGSLSAISSVYETEPWGYASSNSYLNMAIAVETNLSIEDLLNETQKIEKELGRETKTTGSYQDRPIDIDIILYGDLIYQTEKLNIPHPLFHKRDFVLKPLSEIAPNLIEPKSKKTINTLLREL